MQATSGLNGTSVILGILAVALVAAVGFGFNIPVLGSGRAAFFTLAVLGMAMCSRGTQFENYGWLNPFTMAGAVMGTALLLLIGAVAFHIRLPLITSDRAATLVLGSGMAVKVLLALVRAALT